MPKTSMRVAHDLEREEALRRLKDFVPRFREDYQDKISDLEESWSDQGLTFSFMTYGIQIRGEMAIEEKEVVFVGHLPLAALLFRGAIEKSVRDELTRLLT